MFTPQVKYSFAAALFLFLSPLPSDSRVSFMFFLARAIEGTLDGGDPLFVVQATQTGLVEQQPVTASRPSTSATSSRDTMACTEHERLYESAAKDRVRAE